MAKQTIVFELEVDEATGGLTLGTHFSPVIDHPDKVMEMWMEYAEMEVGGQKPPTNHQLALQILAVSAKDHMMEAITIFKGEELTPCACQPSEHSH